MARSRLVCDPNDSGSCVKTVRSQRFAFPRTWPYATMPIPDGVYVSFGRATSPGACHMGYHMVMARREVLVQLDDDLVEQLDALAADLGTNRSELMRRGAQAVLDAERLAAADQELRAAYRRQPADPALVQSARRLAAETAPTW